MQNPTIPIQDICGDTLSTGDVILYQTGGGIQIGRIYRIRQKPQRGWQKNFEYRVTVRSVHGHVLSKEIQNPNTGAKHHSTTTSVHAVKDSTVVTFGSALKLTDERILNAISRILKSK